MRQVLFILAAFLFSCNSKDPLPVPAAADYLPLKTSAYLVYAADSVIVDQNAETLYQYELKTQVTDSFPSSDGGFTYLVQRSKRTTPSSSWIALESWSVRVNEFQAIVNEGNISFTKIVGPLGEGKTWNGNALNILGGEERCLESDMFNCDLYTLINFAKPYEPSPGTTFENTLTVVQNDNKDLIVRQDKRVEVYAKNIGLIYREIIQLEYCTDPSCLGTQFVEKGIRYRQTISDYGGL